MKKYPLVLFFINNFFGGEGGMKYDESKNKNKNEKIFTCIFL